MDRNFGAFIVLAFVLFFGSVKKVFAQIASAPFLVSINRTANGPVVSGANEPDVSADGRFVVFTTGGSDVVPGITSRTIHVFVRDLVTGTTTLVSKNSAGVEGNNYSEHPRISANGRFVVFTSFATNLVANDANANNDVFIHDRTTGTTARVNQPHEDPTKDKGAETAVVSGDGRYVAFLSYASHLGPSGAYLYGINAFVHDRNSGTTTLLSPHPTSYIGAGECYDIEISDDGSTIAFQSRSEFITKNLPNPLNTYLFLTTPAGGAPTPVTPPTAAPADAQWSNGRLSADGRFLALNNHLDEINSNETWLFDRTLNTSQRVVSGAEGVIGYHPRDLDISGDGRRLAWITEKAILASDTNTEDDLYLRDLHTGVTTRISILADGTQNQSDAATPMFSSDGATLVWAWSGGILTPYVNTNDNIFARRLTTSTAPDKTPPAIAIATPTNNAILASLPAISGTASDNVGVTRVDLYLQRKSDNKFWNGSIWTSSAPISTVLSGDAPRQWTRNSGLPSGANLASGLYFVAARAYDAAGNGTSATANFSVSAGGTSPPPSGPVVNTLADHNDGACNTTDCTLREAIAAANSSANGDTISFSVSGTIRLTSALPELTATSTSGALTIRGPSAGGITVSGDVNNNGTGNAGDVRVLTVSNGANVTLERLTITRGYNDVGGGISNAGTLAIIACTVSNNTAVAGCAGIDNTGTLTISESTISNNVVIAGGSGGIGNEGTLKISGSTISNNTASIWGGGIANADGILSLINCTLSGNVANGNSEGSGGGGIDTYGFTSQVTLTSCTISNNAAPNILGGTRGGIWFEDGTLTLSNTIVAGNAVQDIQQDLVAVTSGGYNLIGLAGTATGFIASDRIGVTGAQFKLGPLAGNGGPTQTHLPLPGSLAINAGTPIYAGPLTTDQRGIGYARISAGRLDIGAVEVQSAADAIAPAISIAAPLNNAVVAALPAISGTASDNLGVVRVDLYLQRKSDNKFWNGSIWTSSAPISTVLSGAAPRQWIRNSGLPSGANLASGLYFVAARAYDPAGNGTSATANFSISAADRTPPAIAIAAPGNNAVLASLPAISGTASDNLGVVRVDLYLQRKSDNKFWNGSIWTSSAPISTVLSGAAPRQWIRNSGLPSGANLLSGLYFVAARAYDSAGNGTSATANFSISMVTGLAPPTNLRAAATANRSISLLWNDTNANEEGVRVERRTAGSAWTVIARVAANSTSYVDTNLTAGTTYIYRVSAVRGVVPSTSNGTLGPPSNEASATVPSGGTVVPVPLNLSVGLRRLSANGVGVFWNDVAGETGFRIERKLATGAYTPVGTIAANVVSFFDSTVVRGSTYVYRVRALVGAQVGEPSNEATIAVPFEIGVDPIPVGTVAAKLGNSFSSELQAFRPSSTTPAILAGDVYGERVSPDGTQVLFLSNNHLFVVNSDGTNERSFTQSFEMEQYGVKRAEWSHDGTRIAFTGWFGRGLGSYDVFVCDIASGAIINLTAATDTEHALLHRDLTWSADDAFIYFATQQQDGWVPIDVPQPSPPPGTVLNGLWKVPSGGGAATQFARNVSNVHGLTADSQGRFLAYAVFAYQETFPTNLRRYNFSDGTTSYIGSSSSTPRFSPDGRYLAYRENRAIKIYDTANGSTRTVDTNAINSFEEQGPVWSPNGAYLLYQRAYDRPWLMEGVSFDDDPYDLYSLHVATGVLRRHTDTGGGRAPSHSSWDWGTFARGGTGGGGNTGGLNAPGSLRVQVDRTEDIEDDTETGEGSATLLWNDTLTNEQGFILEGESMTPGTDYYGAGWLDIGIQRAANVTTVSGRDIDSDDQWRYRVRAFTGTGTGRVLGPPSNVVTLPGVVGFSLVTPTEFHLTGEEPRWAGTVQVSFKDNSFGEFQYYFEVLTDGEWVKDQYAYSGLTGVGQTITTYFDGQENTQYTVRLRAYREDLFASPPSAALTFITP